MNVSVVKQVEFAAAHSQQQIGPPCDRVHGHNYKVWVWYKGEVDPQTGIVRNLSDIKADLNKVIVGPCDHRNLNDVYPFFTSIEMLAMYWLETLRDNDQGEGSYWKIRVEETDRSAVEIEW